MSSIQTRANNNNEPLVLDDGAELVAGVIIASGHTLLAAGTVLGEIGSGSTYVPVAITSGIASGVYGSNFPKLILAEDIAAASGQTEVSAYSMGLFSESKLAFGTDADLDTRIPLSTDDNHNVSMRDAMRQMGLRVASDISLTRFENPVI